MTFSTPVPSDRFFCQIPYHIGRRGAPVKTEARPKNWMSGANCAIFAHSPLYAQKCAAGFPARINPPRPFAAGQRLCRTAAGGACLPVGPLCPCPGGRPYSCLINRRPLQTAHRLRTSFCAGGG